MSDAGRDDANQELKERLRNILIGNGWSQAELVRRTQHGGEPISKAAVSNALNPAEGPPAVATLTAILNAAAVTKQERTELFRLRDRAGPQRTDQLKVYLDVVREAARRQPSSGVLRRPRLPMLSDVYVVQQSRRRPADAHDGRGNAEVSTNQAGPPAPASEIFQGSHDRCVLLGVPGSGKSTLLRSFLANFADSGSTLPVMVNAAALTGSGLLPSALATAATGDLQRFGLLDELTSEFFRRAPSPGGSWLVLVDGLDEVPDPDSRIAVLRMLAGAASAGAGLYRFVIATRPLADEELSALGRDVPQYDLQLFSRDDLLTYATRWFQRLDDHGGSLSHAESFLAELERSGLGDLARTPLMASMLCQLYANDPARPLPHGRTAAYESFTALLYEMNPVRAIRGIHEKVINHLIDLHQVHQVYREAERAAWQVLECLPELIGHLAHKRLTRPRIPVTAALAAHTVVQPLRAVHPEGWEPFLEDLLCHTGLLVRQANSLEFLHQTLLEYHAARHATRNEKARSKLLDELFPPVRKRRTPETESSYLGFLLDGLLVPADDIATETSKRIETFTRTNEDDACEFLLEQVKLRTCFPPDSAAKQLRRLAGSKKVSFDNRRHAAEALAELAGYEKEGAGLLTIFASGAPYCGFDRLWPAEYLAKMNGYQEKGVELLMTLANDDSEDGFFRIAAAEYLVAAKGRKERGVGLLTTLAGDVAFGNFHRMGAAEALAKAAGYQQAGAEFLENLAGDLDNAYRLDAAEALAKVDGYTEKGAVLLIACADNLDDPYCLAAAEHLARLDGYETASASRLQAWVDNENTPVRNRVRAAVALATVSGHEEEGTHYLRTVAVDAALAPDECLRAAEALVRLDGHKDEGATALKALAENVDVDPGIRRYAAETLSRVDGHEEEGILIQLTVPW